VFQPGDTITLTSSPTLQIAAYQFVKAGASVTRVLGGDPAADFAALERDLRAAVLRSIAQEINILNGSYDAIEGLGDGTLEGLLEYCVKEGNSGGAFASVVKVPATEGTKVGEGRFGKKPKGPVSKKPEASSAGRKTGR